MPVLFSVTSHQHTYGHIGYVQLIIDGGRQGRGRTTGRPQVSWKTFPQERFCQDQYLSPCGEVLRSCKPVTLFGH